MTTKQFVAHSSSSRDLNNRNPFFALKSAFIFSRAVLTFPNSAQQEKRGLKMSKCLRLLLISVLSLGSTTQVFATGSAGIGNDVPSARAAGQGYVGITGQNDDPTVVYANPAALTNLKGTQVSVGATWENLHGNYKDNSGGETHMRSLDVGVPNFATTQSFLDGKLGTGLSVGSPYGLETHWAGDSPLRYVATNSVLHLVDVSPGVGYRICPMVSVGVAADYVNLFDATLEKHVNVNVINAAMGVPTAGAADANSRLSGTAANWGYHVGLMVQPNAMHAFGFTYHSRIKLNVNGTVELAGLSGVSGSPFGFGSADFKTSAYTDIYLPQNIQFGYSFKPNDKWIIEADTAWFDWSSNRNLDVRLPGVNPALAPLLSAGNPSPFDWRDNWSLTTGANYKATDKLQVRGGFWYQPWVEPESAFNPGLIDLTRYGLSMGIGYALTTSFSVDASYNAVFFHNRTISNNLGAATGIPGYNIDGNYSNFANVVGLNLTYRYGAK